MLKTAQILIFGHVQGVGFRYGVSEKARDLNLKGWVRNTENGSVEIMASGQEKDLKRLIKWCYNGVEGAEVEKVETEWKEHFGEFNNFLIYS